MVLFLKLTSLFLFFFTGMSLCDTFKKPWEKNHRIPEYIKPISYDVFLNPDLNKGSFVGESTILVNVTTKTTWIPVHIKNLNVQESRITDSKGASVKVVEAFSYSPSEFWIMKMSEIHPGLFSIHLKFTGSLVQSIVGFYRSVYYENGTTRWPSMMKPYSEQPQNSDNFAMSAQWDVNSRIPDYVKPIGYDIFINPNLEKGVFEGNVAISLRITGFGSYVPIHTKNLEVTSSALVRNNGTVVPSTALHCEKNSFWVLSVPEEQGIQAGEYTLNLGFKGIMTGKIIGFHRLSYLNENNVQREIATTKFEPVDARQAFPCFDEPNLKAKFKIRIARPKEGYSALSNMQVSKEEPGPGADQVTVHFAETVPMSTYLVCFIVSDFKDSGPVTVNNMGKPFPVRVFSTPGQVGNTIFAKTAAAAVSKFYIDYFDIPYALPKLDLIGIPDFISGAMENWGLITFRETGLLFKENENSASNKQRVASTIAHEVSHQWFGNLVTMKWWDDLWLNEGFASFMEYKGVHYGIPECKDWQMLDQAIYEKVHDVMKLDSVVSSHPIIQPVNNPNQITELFDKISYSKGLAVLRMLEGFMGEENFNRGIQKYLKQYSYSNAATSDLWECLDREISQSGINVGDVMNTWTKQMGLPVIGVVALPDRWQLSQERFLSDSGATYTISESPYNYKWDIPIHYVTDDGHSKLIWFLRNQNSIAIPRDPKTNFIHLNHQHLGFYRVNYDTLTWKAFENLLKSDHEKLDRRDRANIIDDAFNLAGAGQLDYGIALGITGYLKKEKEFLPWATASGGLSEIIRYLFSSTFYPHIRGYVRSLVGNLYGSNEGQFSWNVNPNDPHIHRLLRVKILSLACYSGLPSCLDDAGTKFMEWIDKPDTYIHPDVRSLVYRYGMTAVGRESEWDSVWNRYLNEKNVQEKINLLEALASVREPWLLSRFVKLAKNESYIRSQDYFSVLSYISRNPVGRPIVWNFFRNEWPYLVERFTLYHRTLGSFIATVTNGFSTEVELEEMEAFYKKYPDAGAGENARKQALDSVRHNINWLKKNEDGVGQWLLGQSGA